MKHIIVFGLFLFVQHSFGQNSEGIRVVSPFDSVKMKSFTNYSRVIKENGGLQFYLSVSDNCMCEGDNCSNISFKTTKRKRRIELDKIKLTRSYPASGFQVPKSTIDGWVKVLKIRRKRVKVMFSFTEIINASKVKWEYEFKGWIPVLKEEELEEYIKFQKNCFDGYKLKHLNL